MCKELIEFTRTVFPISRERRDTTIGGLSMGGYGAIRNGLKHSDVFGNIIAFSSALLTDRLAAGMEQERVGAEEGPATPNRRAIPCPQPSPAAHAGVRRHDRAAGSGDLRRWHCVSQDPSARSGNPSYSE